MSISRHFFCCLALVSLAACSKTESPAAPAANAPPPAVATEAAAAPGGITGIAECDQFLSAYEQCLNEKLPEQARTPMLAGLTQWKTAWRDMASNPATKDALPQICEQSRTSSRAAMQAYGCSL